MVWTGPTTPQSAIDNWGRAAVMSTRMADGYEPPSMSLTPPPTVVRPELTDDDVAWLNQQMALTDQAAVRYARELPLPPLSSGIVPRPAPVTSWITLTQVRH